MKNVKPKDCPALLAAGYDRTFTLIAAAALLVLGLGLWLWEDARRAPRPAATRVVVRGCRRRSAARRAESTPKRDVYAAGRVVVVADVRIVNTPRAKRPRRNEDDYGMD